MQTTRKNSIGELKLTINADGIPEAGVYVTREGARYYMCGVDDNRLSFTDGVEIRLMPGGWKVRLAGGDTIETFGDSAQKYTRADGRGGWIKTSGRRVPWGIAMAPYVLSAKREIPFPPLANVEPGHMSLYKLALACLYY